jgi:hypothetical protein
MLMVFESRVFSRLTLYRPEEPSKGLGRIGRVLDLTRLFEIPAWQPDRMIAAQLVLYIGLAIIIATTLWSHWRAMHP